MSQTYRVFNIGQATVIACRDLDLVQQFIDNPKWVKLQTKWPLPIFVSKNGAQEVQKHVQNQGLPARVVKGLVEMLNQET